MTDWIIGSCVLIVAVLAIRKAFGTRISSRFRYALWAVVMIRLICPATLWNNQQLTQTILKTSGQLFQSRGQQENKLDTTDSNAEPGMEDRQNTGSANMTGMEDTNSTDRKKNDNYTGNVKNQNTNIGQQNGQAINQTENSNTALRQNGFNQTGKEEAASQLEEYAQSKDSNSNIFHRTIAQLFNIAPAIWLSGIIVVGLWFIGINIRFYRILMRSRKKIVGIEKLPIYQVKGLSSPCLFGVIHPAIYLKEETRLQDDQLFMILQHERCHYHHKDHIWSAMRTLCVVVWWWNPLVWAAAAVSRRDCEMACDEGTLEMIGWENKFLYAKTLVDAVSDRKSFGIIVAATMVSGKSDTERRLHMMLNRKKTKMASAILAVGLMLNAAALCFGGESTVQSETLADHAEQTALPVLSAADEYEQIPTTEGVEEFCENCGLLDKEYVAQITPEWMKDNGIALFRDALNERVYLIWQEQMMVLPQLALGRIMAISDVDVLSSALADLDEDGIYEVYFTARTNSGLQYCYNLVGVARLTDMSFYWSFDMQEDLDMQNVLMLTQNENGELVCRSARKTEEKEKAETMPTAFSLTVTEDMDAQPVTLSEEDLVAQPSKLASSDYPVGFNTGLATELDTSGWLIPAGGPRWSWTVDELKEWYGDALTVVSESDSKTVVQISGIHVWDCDADITATVDKEVGVTGLEYHFAYEDRDTVVNNMNNISQSSQIVGGTKEQSEGVLYSWEGKQAATFEAAGQKRFGEICKQRGTWSDAEEKRYAHQVTAQVAITTDACNLSFEAEPEIVIFYRELLQQSCAELETEKESWNPLYEQYKDDWTLQWNSGYTTMGDYESKDIEKGSEDMTLRNMAQSIIEDAQPYPFGGFAENLYQMGWTFSADRLKKSEDDMNLYLYKDNSTVAGFLLHEDGSGYVQISFQEEDTVHTALFSFTPSDAGKELYRAAQQEINTSDTTVAQ